jgi:hypothetical protein
MNGQDEAVWLLRLQAEKDEAIAKAAPKGSGARKAALEAVRVTREALALVQSPPPLPKEPA